LERKTKIYLVRHGQTNWNVEEKIQGQIDIPLNETGRAQALALKDRLKNVQFAACFSSDLSRAYETAEILVEGRGLEIIREERLRERSYGEWEGLTLSLYKKMDGENKGGAETRASVLSRALQVLEELNHSHEGKTLLATSHGAFLKTILIHILRVPPDTININNTAFVELVYQAGQWCIESMHDVELGQVFPNSL
jgi:probable phosphoglycerate mutase